MKHPVIHAPLAAAFALAKLFAIIYTLFTLFTLFTVYTSLKG